MKKLIPIIVLILLSSYSALAKPATETADTTTAHEEKPTAVSNHSFSLQIVGIEYGYEQKLGGSFSMVFRAGLVPSGLSYFCDLYNTSFSFKSSLGITVEPRFYTNFGRRARLGKSTFKNSADFVALKIQSSMPKGLDISLTPMYGIRRVWGKHWFGEFSAGGRIGFTWGSGIYIAPHIQYRLGFVF